MEELFDQFAEQGQDGTAAEPPRLLSPAEFLRLTSEEVDRAGRYDRPLSLAMLVFDKLGQFRDLAGKHKTEEALDTLLERVVKLLRTPDRTARLGPNDVGVLMPETTLKNAAAVAERIRCAIAEHASQTDDLRLRAVSVSIGVATLSPRIRDPRRFLMTACFELRRAQSRGGDSVSVAEPDTVRLSIPRSGQIH